MPVVRCPGDEVETRHGHLIHARNHQRRDSYRTVVSRAGEPVEATGSGPNLPGLSYGVVFAEVRVHSRLGSVRVTRVVTAHDIGKGRDQLPPDVREPQIGA
ncbi:molybdopterin cofactor-binding domain-containing protein [Lentzea sp. NPDC051208]|uniref:molybdopterin cofactor-binding domain-containing protein n=1 Tax=Lentzea sp. NPDC051208 TaxID=3154642 RepID=UPI0034407659